MRQFFGLSCVVRTVVQREGFGSKMRTASFVVALLGLLIPSLANAQIREIPTVVVVDLSVRDRVNAPNVGQIAAEAIRTELARSTDQDIVALETIKRALEDLGQEGIPTDKATLTRLAQTLSATSIVVGEVADSRIYQVGNGRQAAILLRVEMRDVASGLAINGAQVVGRSGVRTGDVSDETLLDDAAKSAAFEVAREMSARQLPSATVLNTLPKSALINKGSRAGFRAGMEVIIVRGRDQIGSATVTGVDEDSSFINFGRLIKGVQPGDKVKSVYTPESNLVKLTDEGKVKGTRVARKGSNSGLVSLLLVLVALGFLLGQGRGSDLTLAKVHTQATVTATDTPAVVISWTRDPFLRGSNDGPWQWQVWRQDVPATPVAVADGLFGFVVDDAVGSNSLPWVDLEDQTSTLTCEEEPTVAENVPLPLAPGTPYQYQVSLIYRIPGASMPFPEEAEWCYFKSRRIVAQGLATPLVRPELRSPDPDQVVTTPISFQFTSVRGTISSVILEYVVQISDQVGFPANRTVTFAPFQEFVEAGGQTISSPTLDTTTFFIGSNDIYWRVGARNIADIPGPVMDPTTGKRYVFSAIRRFKRLDPPPFSGSGG